jgi:hypothetical protein
MCQRPQGFVACQAAGAIGAQLRERASGRAGNRLQFGPLGETPGDDAPKQFALWRG